MIYLRVINGLTIFLSLLFCHVLAANAADTPKLLKATPLSQTAIQLQFDGQLQAENRRRPINLPNCPRCPTRIRLARSTTESRSIDHFTFRSGENLSPHTAKYSDRDSYYPHARKRDNFRPQATPLPSQVVYRIPHYMSIKIGRHETTTPVPNRPSYVIRPEVYSS